MNPTEVLVEFERHGVLHRGHFRLSSGRHSDTYLQCARILQHPRVAASLGEALAARVRERAEFSLVASPALGGILIGFAVAHAAGARFVFAERVDGRMTFRRGQDVERTDTVLVVEDVITTGGSAAQVVDLVKQTGARVVGVGSLVDRSQQQPPFHLDALVRVEARDWDPNDCPSCKEGRPVESPGSRYLTDLRG